MITATQQKEALTRLAITFAALMVCAAGVANAQDASARLSDGRVPAAIPRAYGGGEVVLELTVDAEGSVSQIARIRMTPPYLDFMVQSVAPWRFTPATTTIDGSVTPVAAPVLVVAIFRAPSVYAGPISGPGPQVIGAISGGVPSVASVVLPAYPPTAIGDGVVVIEIEMTHRAEPRHYRIVGASSAFDDAAVEAVRAWRFAPPRDADVPEPLYTYAVVGFRALLTLPADSRK